MDERRHAIGRETQDGPQSEVRGARQRRGRMLAAGIVMLLAVAAAALGQPAQGPDQERPGQPPQVQPAPPQPGQQPGQAFRERLERQRQELIQQRERLVQEVQQAEARLQQTRQTLNEQSRRLERELDGLHRQIRQTDYELAELHRQELAERTRRLEDQLRNHQEQSQRIERELQELEQARGGQRPGPERERPTLGGWEETPRPGRTPESRMCGSEQRDEELRQINGLRRRVNQLEQELKASNRPDRPQAGSPGVEPCRRRTLLEPAQRPLVRVERNRPPRQGSLAGDVDALQSQVGAIQQEVTQTRALLDAVLSQTGRSTVGSAGYTWGW